MVEVAARETDLSCMEPLEPPFHGDCDLAEIRRLFGTKLALRGKMQTARLAMATPEELKAMAKWCIDVAGEGGGYVLSAGDQLSRDTPDENTFRLVQSCRKYHRYPLNRK